MPKILTPFTDEQVAALNGWQKRGDVHEFTFPNHSGIALVASPDGWRCLVVGCAYTQNWAHDFMVQGNGGA